MPDTKKEHGMKVLDSARERAKLNDIASMVPEELSEYAISLYSLIFELSRSSQNRIIGASTPLTEEIARAVKVPLPLFPQRAAVAVPGRGGRIFPNGMRQAVQAGKRALFFNV